MIEFTYFGNVESSQFIPYTAIDSCNCMKSFDDVPQAQGVNHECLVSLSTFYS